MISIYHKKGCIISEIIFAVSVAVSLVLSFFVREDLRRLNDERFKRQKLSMKTNDSIHHLYLSSPYSELDSSRSPV